MTFNGQITNTEINIEIMYLTLRSLRCPLWDSNLTLKCQTCCFVNCSSQQIIINFGYILTTNLTAIWSIRITVLFFHNSIAVRSTLAVTSMIAPIENTYMRQ